MDNAALHQRIQAPFTAHYPTDVRHMIGEIKGPNTMGEYFRAVGADWDGERTTVTFEVCRDRGRS